MRALQGYELPPLDSKRQARLDKMLHQYENRLKGIRGNDNKRAECGGGTSCHGGVVGAGARRCGHGDPPATTDGGGEGRRHESIPGKIELVTHVRLPDDEQEKEEEEKHAGPSADGGGGHSLEVEGVELVERTAASAAADGGGGGDGSWSTVYAAAAIPTAAVLEAGVVPAAAGGVRDGGGGGETSSGFALV
ncbi:unnamed protein product [Ectocarpus sp. 13 AM-2016]